MRQGVAAPGFFGKVPARGDFLDRRIPAGLQPVWEAWLSGLVVSARAGLGPAWPEAWLTAPLWHFALGRDVAPPLGCAGVVLGSVDRVGRFFPFSIIGAAAPRPDLRADDWVRSAEAMALAALADDFDPDRLDAGLRALGPPPAVEGFARGTGIWRLPIADGWPAPPGDALSGDALSEAAWLPPGPGQSAWWCRGSERMVAVHLRVTGLPNERLSAAMVTGRYDSAEGGDAALDPAGLSLAASSGDGSRDASAAAVEAEGHGSRPVDPLAFLERRDDPLAD